MEPVEALHPHLFMPTPERPVRAKQHRLSARTRVIPHSHRWAQISVSLDGVLHLAAPQGTLIAPPSKAVWIPPGLVHAVAMVEEADLISIYVRQDLPAQGPVLPGLQAGTVCDPQDWARCRVLEISPLMRELITALPKQGDDQPAPDAATLQREHHLSVLLLEELRQAREVNLGVDMPQDKRLRMLCEAVVADPTQHDSLADWAADTGASPHRGPAVPAGAGLQLHGLAPAGGAGPCREPGRAQPAHTADRGGTGLQPQRLQRHGAPHRGHAAGALLRAAGRPGPGQGGARRCIRSHPGRAGGHRPCAIADPI
jgi:hypothetical protein